MRECSAALAAEMPNVRKERTGGPPHDRSGATGAGCVPTSGRRERPRSGSEGARHHLLGPTAALPHPRRRAEGRVRSGGGCRCTSRTRLGCTATACIMACGRCGRAHSIPPSASRAGRCRPATQLLCRRAGGRRFLSRVREFTLRENTRRPGCQRFLPGHDGRFGPREHVALATEFVAPVRAVRRRKRGPPGRTDAFGWYVGTRRRPRYAPGPNVAAWGPPGRRRFRPQRETRRV